MCHQKNLSDEAGSQCLTLLCFSHHLSIARSLARLTEQKARFERRQKNALSDLRKKKRKKKRRQDPFASRMSPIELPFPVEQSPKESGNRISINRDELFSSPPPARSHHYTLSACVKHPNCILLLLLDLFRRQDDHPTQHTDSYPRPWGEHCRTDQPPKTSKSKSTSGKRRLSKVTAETQGELEGELAKR